jgi:hypothetical protein
VDGLFGFEVFEDLEKDVCRGRGVVLNDGKEDIGGISSSAKPTLWYP